MNFVRREFALILMQLAVGWQTGASQPEPAVRRDAGAAASRYELGRRTRAMERAWMACDDPQRRQAAVPLVQGAVNGFFLGNSGQVARSLDEAAAALRGETRSDAQAWADALQVSFGPRLLDRDEQPQHTKLLDDQDPTNSKSSKQAGQGVWLRASWAYEPKVSRPALRLKLHAKLGGEPLLDRPLDATVDAAISLPADSERDATLFVTVCDESGTLVREWTVGISRVQKLHGRLAALREACESLPDDALAIESASARRILDLLSRLVGGEILETDLPAARLLRDAEQFVVAGRERRPAFARKSGEFTLAVPTGKSVAPVRVVVPTLAPTVAVVALHGAGGSENMFFDAYGDGMIVRLCRERGWMLMAPKVGTPLDDVWSTVEAIESVFDVRIRQRLIVGHSLGAVTALAMGQRQPDRVAALAAISGGSFGDLQPLRSTPVFVAAGTQDFGKAGASGVAKRLAELGAPVQFKLYECEHLLVVPDSLPDIFQWFDTIAGAEAAHDGK